MQRAPGLVGGVRQDRREQLAEHRDGVVHDLLRAATPCGITRIAVQAILGRGAVDRRERLVAEVEDRHVRRAEVIRRVGRADGRLQGGQLRQRPPVDRGGLDRHARTRHEALEVGEQEADRVADLAVALAGEPEVLEVDLDVTVVGHAAHPPPRDVRAVLLQQHRDVERVAEALGHLQAILVDHEAVRQERAERRLARDGECGQQRELEPTAVLVAALEVQLARETDAARAKHRVPAAAGLEPDIEDVAALAEGRQVEPGRCIGILRRVVAGQEFLCGELEPGIAALLREDRGDRTDARGRHERAAVGAQERRDRQAP